MVSIGGIGSSIVNGVKDAAGTVKDVGSDVGDAVSGAVKEHGVSVLKTGVIVTASVAGAAVAGPAGAAVAGGLTAGALSAADQQIREGHIDWGNVAIDGAAGALPGGVMAKLGGKAATSFGFRKAGEEIANNTVKNYVVDGAIAGATVGGFHRGASSSYEQLKRDGSINLQDTLINTGIGAATGGVTGGLASRALAARALRTPPDKTDIISKKVAEKTAPRVNAHGVTGKVAAKANANAEVAKAAEAPTLRETLGIVGLNSLTRSEFYDYFNRLRSLA